MATWMAHLRVADKILKNTQGLDKKLYIVGSIAPDSGVPTKDWKTFVPDSTASHFKVFEKDGSKKIDIDQFINGYFSKKHIQEYNNEQFSFYLGYYNHLLTDILWVEKVFKPSVDKDKKEYMKDSSATVWKWKKDWYDLDFLFLSKNPDFEAFKIYSDAVGVKNKYLDIFAEDAFDNRRKYISNFYMSPRQDIVREYPYLNECQMDDFVEYAAKEIVTANQEILDFKLSNSKKND